MAHAAYRYTGKRAAVAATTNCSVCAALSVPSVGVCVSRHDLQYLSSPPRALRVFAAALHSREPASSPEPAASRSVTVSDSVTPPLRRVWHGRRAGAAVTVMLTLLCVCMCSLFNSPTTRGRHKKSLPIVCHFHVSKRNTCHLPAVPMETACTPWSSPAGGHRTRAAHGGNYRRH